MQLTFTAWVESYNTRDNGGAEGGGEEHTDLVKIVSLYQCTSLSIGAPLGKLEGGSFTRDFER